MKEKSKQLEQAASDLGGSDETQLSIETQPPRRLVAASGPHAI